MAHSDAAPHTHDHPKPKKSLWGMGLQIAFLVFALWLLVFPESAERQWKSTLAIKFVSIVLEALPFVLLGSLVGGFVEVFVPRERMAAWLPKRKWVTVLVAAGLGVVFPVCECAIVPVVRRLLRKGVPVGAAIAYLLGGPIVNPIVAASTAVAYSRHGPVGVVATRLLCGYAIAVFVGLVINLIFGNRPALVPEAEATDDDHDCCGHAETARGKVAAAVRHAADDFYDIGRFLVIGAFIAGLLQTLVPRQAFAAATGSPVLAILLMMALAVILNLCSEADAFIAATFHPKPGGSSALLAGISVPLYAQMAFMVLGPMFDIKLLLMYLRVFRKRTIVALVALTLTSVFAAMLLLWWISG